MPFTEEDLRETLAAHSAGEHVPPSLAPAAVARRARTVRRRRRVAGGALTAAAVAAIVAVPSLAGPAGPQRAPVLAAPAATLDPTIFQTPGIELMILRDPADIAKESQYVVTGTVEGFAPRSPVSAKDVSVVMRVRVETWVKGRPTPDGRLYVGVGGGDRSKTPERFARAVPAGSRLMLFLPKSRTQLLDVDTGHLLLPIGGSQSTYFEKADGHLVGTNGAEPSPAFDPGGRWTLPLLIAAIRPEQCGSTPLMDKERCLRALLIQSSALQDCVNIATGKADHRSAAQLRRLLSACARKGG
ncbi:hypothetical protein [Actinomadura macrotermitis]|uniref:Uncharacterized protein n=1 Tax=Actinomadura macrotermitis TaxID=2585200 RepID=A0A7K0BPQ1_9ACTN|nr:hypothetical protein [Actinomadura macrotermitis]MQY03180.1 hypothetical protein [Actinomadura macrotermitis]